MRTILLTLFISGYTVFSFSQDCQLTISGKVYDTHDQSPLIGATVIVAGPEIAVLSDFDGSYEIKGICPGEYVIQISHPECNAKVFKVNLTEDTTKDFRLEHHLETLNEIMITGKSFTTKTETVLENTLSLEKLEQFSGNSIGDALRNLSGVSSLNTGNTVVKPVINGLHSSRIAIINNGVRMQDQEWGAEHAPNLDINSAQRITVIKGASALQYSGDAIGGIIISEPSRIPIKDTLFGKSIFSFATNGRGGSNTTTLNKGFKNGWYAQVQGTLKRFGDYETPDYVLSNTGNFERDAMIRLGQYKINWGWEAHYSIFKNDIGILRASHLGGAEDQVIAINNPRPLIIEPFTYTIDRPRQEVTHHIARLSGFKDFEHLGKLSLSYDFQSNRRFEFDIRRGDDAEIPSVDLRLNTHDITLSLENSFGDWDVKAGTVFQYQDNFANPDTGVRRLIPDYEQYRFSSFVVSNWEVNDHWSLEGGLRWDYTQMDVFKFYRTSFWEARGYDQLFPEIVVEEFGNQILTAPELSFSNVSATLGSAYELNDAWTIYANLSLASRAPNASELFSEGLHHSASRIELGDLRFDSEQSKKFLLTLQKKGTLSFAINPFFQAIDNFVIIEPTGVEQTIRGNFQVWEYRQAPVQMMGLDIDLSTPIIDALSFQHTFSIVKAYEKNNDLPLINIPPVNFSNELLFQKNKLRASLRQEYYFRQNEFPDTNFEVFLPETQTTALVDVSTPPDAYQLWSMMASYNFPFLKKSNMEVGIQIQNLFNSTYRNYLNRLRYYADDLGRNFILNTKINF